MLKSIESWQYHRVLQNKIRDDNYRSKGWNLSDSNENAENAPVGSIRFCYKNHRIACGKIVDRTTIPGLRKIQILDQMPFFSPFETRLLNEYEDYELNEYEHVMFVGKEITLEDFKKYAPILVYRYQHTPKPYLLSWADQLYKDALLTFGYVWKD